MNKFPLDTKEDPARKWRWFVLLLLVFSLFVTAGMASVVIYYEFILPQSHNLLNSHELPKPLVSDNEVYKDLSIIETQAIKHYLQKHPIFNLNLNISFALERSYVFLVQLHLPSKADIVQRHNLQNLTRNAEVVLFRGDLDPPLIEEYLIGPLHNISFHKLLVSKHYQKSVPFLFRPFSQLDYLTLDEILLSLEDTIGHVLMNCYEASFFDCRKHCLKVEYFSPMSPSISGKYERLVWYWVHHDVPDYVLFPVDLFLLINMTDNDHSKHKLYKIWLGNKLYDSPEQLVTDFESNSDEMPYIPYTNRANIVNHFETNPDDLYWTKTPTLSGNHIKQDFWEFDVKMATVSGPSVFNVIYKDIYYAYEISLQEISIFHNGYNRWMRYSDLTYSGTLLGTRARVLERGIDCPEHAIFISSSHVYEGTLEPTIIPNTSCVFNEESGSHYKYRNSSTYRYSDSLVLYVRSILTVFNYDHIFDFIFKPNGAITIRTSFSGRPLPTMYSPEENRYGFRLNENLVANIHQHSYHFKVDMDVFGQKNRFETLDIDIKRQENDWMIQSFQRYEQLKFTRSLKMTENQAKFEQESKLLKYYIFYNRDHLTKYKDPKAIRLNIMSDAAIPTKHNVGNEASVSWKRYGLAVTKHHDDEQSSSSIYSTWDGKETVVNFQSFIDDNENIIDQDLVGWVTLTSTHIPHTEDFPLMSTSDYQYFSLTPFNLFPENPMVNKRQNK